MGMLVYDIRTHSQWTVDYKYRGAFWRYNNYILCDVIKARCYVVDIMQLILNKYFNTNMLTLLTACKTVVSS